MKKVITYGTYDLLHYGHIKLLERAKELGDYLIVGVTADDFDRQRGKINVQHSLETRIEAIRKTGLADMIIVEEYEGQKIDDIKRYDIDIFTVGSDWEGIFDYLNEYCDVIYLQRTEGVSSSEIREKCNYLRLGIVGHSSYLNKFYKESLYVDGIKIVGICSDDMTKLYELNEDLEIVTSEYNVLLDGVDAVYLHSCPQLHYKQAKYALMNKKHVLCESPLAMNAEECRELFEIAQENGCIIMEAIRTAYLTAYNRLLLLLKAGKIGKVVSVDATCTSLSINQNFGKNSFRWGSLEAWGPTALLPIFQLLGTNYKKKSIFLVNDSEKNDYDIFSKINFEYNNATATVKVGTGIKSEGTLIISGTNGYAYVPAPWWKTDYFEIRYENADYNKRYFYQVEGEGTRYELVAFVDAIKLKKSDFYIDKSITCAIADIFQKYSKDKDTRND